MVPEELVGKYHTIVPKESKENRVKFELFGIEMVEKEVRSSGKTGRIYLPPDWVGCKVKIVKID
jgi:hypothetical protein